MHVLCCDFSDTSRRRNTTLEGSVIRGLVTSTRKLILLNLNFLVKKSNVSCKQKPAIDLLTFDTTCDTKSCTFRGVEIASKAKR